MRNKISGGWVDVGVVMKHILLSAGILFFLGSSGCSPASEVSIAGSSYFPLRVGNFQIYQVTVDTILQKTCGTGGDHKQSFQLKTLVSDSASTAAGGYQYVINRFRRADSTQAWAPWDTWTARVSSNEVVVNQSNVVYLKFTLPLVNNAVWNSNTYNDLGLDYDTLRRVGQSYTLSSGKKFNQTITSQYNKISLVARDSRAEVYAATVGLIYQQSIQLSYFTDPSCFGLNEVKSGVAYSQSLLSYGHQ